MKSKGIIAMIAMGLVSVAIAVSLVVVGVRSHKVDNQNVNIHDEKAPLASGNEKETKKDDKKDNKKKDDKKNDDKKNDDKEEGTKNNKKSSSKKPMKTTIVGLAHGVANKVTAPVKGNNGNASKNPYRLVWDDEFMGTTLDESKWNYETHEPGWVNNELQEYVVSDENVFIENGNLVIQAIKNVDENGKVSYTSGRVNTQDKETFTYGKFEARIKMPSGQGFLPAFWMMPNNENLYGQWPKCGEIDIAEVLGNNTNTTYGTLHFGEPHTQKQGSYTLPTGDFSNEFHTYACEWEPSEIRFYVDGTLFYKTNDWFTKRDGYGEIAYPAPYDQPFYMILNLAVGGDWPGNPDASTKFDENARLVVDYVRVYQKDNYDENVTKPVKEITLREANEDGNFVNNGDFSVEESLTDDVDWKFLNALGGNATATIENSAIKIETASAGTVDYSVQLVQPNIPMKQGSRYRLSFDAKASENRTIITDITAPDLNYIRYLEDKKVAITTEYQNYSIEFDMTSASDPNGRVEFNLGNQGSTADVEITNVRVEEIGTFEVAGPVKSVLPDGNYVYNGGFDEGANRLDYWTLNVPSKSAAGVTNKNNVRQLYAKAVANSVVCLSQNLAVKGNKNYCLTFDAYTDADTNANIAVAIANLSETVSISKENQTYKYTFTTPADVDGSDLVFIFADSKLCYIDNVRLQEDGMLVNGDFSNGLVGYSVYNAADAVISYGVDELTENGAFAVTIDDTGDQDWKIQLKQENITLEKGKWYHLSFQAKSTLDRTIMCALQRDGSSDDNWIPYSGTMKYNINGDYQTCEVTFQMTNETDTKTILSLSMGAVNGTQLKEKHTICIDNIVLEETQAVVTPGVESGEELIKNGDFAAGSENWEIVVNAPGSVSNPDTIAADNDATFEITNVGTEDWHIQMKQWGITLEQGATYDVSFEVTSTEDRIIKSAFMTPTYNWYGGGDHALKAGEKTTVTYSFYVDKETANNIGLFLSMGMINGETTPASTITIDNISLKKR